MKSLPFFLFAAATVCLLTPVLSQNLMPGTQAPAYRVQVAWQKAVSGPAGLVIRGRVTNTGSAPLTYTQVEPVLCDKTGKIVYKVQGYLTASPILPGQSAEFRAFAPDAPAFHSLHVEFHEAGTLVTVDEAKLGPFQNACGRILALTKQLRVQ